MASVHVATMLGRLLLLLIVCGLIFPFIESRWPGVVRAKRYRAGLLTDLAYWFFTPVITQILTAMLISGTMLVGLAVLGDALSIGLITGPGPMANQPLWQQVSIGLLLGDLLYYWVHRLFHRRPLWRFHAIHHSSEEVDWLSAVRLHPINNLTVRVVQALFMALMGFDPAAIAIAVPLLYVYAILLHSKVDWNFGYLGYVFVSPVYHRWHHTRENVALNKNFTGMFVLWDMVFGTWYIPSERRPAEYGTSEPVPERFFPQMVYPFMPSRFGTDAGPVHTAEVSNSQTRPTAESAQSP